MAKKVRGGHDKLRCFASDCDEPSFFKLLRRRLEASRCRSKLGREIVNGAAISILEPDGIGEPRNDVFGTAL